MSSKESKRETWSRSLDFLFATIGSAVGFGNVWRFPYVCYRNGGGVFLIPYLLAVVVIGIPAIFLEGALGQFMSSGAVYAWKITPLFRGIGFAQSALLFFSNVYYIIILAWVLYYLFSSFTMNLPWSTCSNSWNTPNCREHLATNNSLNDSSSAFTTSLNSTVMNETNFRAMDPATEYWERKVLDISSGIDVAGTIKWDLALCLLLAWILVYFCIWKGIKMSGKISYVTVISPYILLIVLLVRGLTLPGAVNGIKFFLIPKWSKLGVPQVWIEAGIQVFYSYGVGVAVHTALGSCNKFKTNTLKHYVVYCVVNSGTSLLSGFVVFSILGFMADKYKVDVAHVAGSGPGLAFVAYPEAVAQMPAAPLWSCAFFLLLFLLGYDSQFVFVEAFMITLGDIFPKWFLTWPQKPISTGAICFICFLCGLTMTTQGGVYVEQLIEWYCAGRIVLLVLALECFALSYIYGISRIQRNLEYMLGYRIGPFFRVCWSVVTPLIAGCLFVTDAVLYPELSYKRKIGTYFFPAWSRAVGWILSLSAISFIPGYMVYRLVIASGNVYQRFCLLTKPEFNEVQVFRDSQTLKVPSATVEDPSEKLKVELSPLV